MSPQATIHHRLLTVAIVTGLIMAMLTSIVPPAVAQQNQTDSCQFIDLTGRYLCEPFHEFWESNGGTAVIGFPISDRFKTLPAESGQPVTTQFFERQRLEHHPDNAGTGYEVLLGQVGVEALTRQGRDWRTFPAADPQAEYYVPETGHAIGSPFFGYWESHGLDLGDPGISYRESLALFGYPISEPQLETNSSYDTVITQWFERARMEFHPDNAPESQVLLGRLGAELFTDEPAPKINLELVAEGLIAPVAIVPAPDETGRLFIVDQTGVIWILTAGGDLIGQPFVNISSRMVLLNAGYEERGLLGLAFHPSFASNGLFYLHYSAPLRAGAPEGWDHTARISEFQVAEGNPMEADMDSERILLQVDQPHWAHNGGTMVFGPDGYLYIGLGDGGHGADVGPGHVDDWYDVNSGGNGQDITTNLLGSILRINVDSGDPYGIPNDNPFIGRPGLDEIYAYGFRNPYRLSFDLQEDQRLFAGDVGQDRWEEIDIVHPGGNYGWNVREGSQCFFADGNTTGPPSLCPERDPDGYALIDPVIEFPNSGTPGGGLGRAVIGGFVYRGSSIVDLYGHYIFGSWSQDWGEPGGQLFFARRPTGNDARWALHQLPAGVDPGGMLGHYLLGFGQDNQGELYILTSDRLGLRGETGRVYRLVPAQ